MECMKVSNSFPLIAPLWFYSKAVNLCIGAATHGILALTFEAVIRMSLLSNTSLLFRGHIWFLSPHPARITNSDTHKKISSLFLYHQNRAFESGFLLNTVFILDSVLRSVTVLSFELMATKQNHSLCVKQCTRRAKHLSVWKIVK